MAGKGRAFTEGLRGGVTFGFADEGTGALSATLDKLTGQNKDYSWSDLYRMYRDDERAKMNAAQEMSPAAYFAGNVIGGIPTAIAGAGAAGATSTGAKMGVGALEGAIGGYGGSDDETLAGQATDTAIGAAIGGPGGYALGKTLGAAKDLVVDKIPVPDRAEFIRLFQGLSRPARGDRRHLGRAEVEIQPSGTDPDTILIETLEANKPGQGGGTQALELLKGIANETKTPLELYPAAFGRNAIMDTPALRDWYRRRGFSDAPDKAPSKLRGYEVEEVLTDAAQDPYEVQRMMRDTWVKEKTDPEYLRLMQSVAERLRGLRELEGGMRYEPPDTQKEVVLKRVADFLRKVQD